MIDYRKLAEICGTPYEIYHGEYKGVFTGDVDILDGVWGFPHYRFEGGVSLGGNKVNVSLLEKTKHEMMMND